MKGNHLKGSKRLITERRVAELVLLGKADMSL